MGDIAAVVDRVAGESGFTGVVRLDTGGEPEFERAYGLADRAHDIPMTTDAQLAVASGTKGFTALAVMSLVLDGTLSTDTTARSLLGDDLPLIAEDVTVGHLLTHTSGIGDYLDEDLDLPINAYAMPVPVHRLAAPEDYLAVLDGFPTVFPAGERFSYNNGGYVVLAILAERASGVPYHDLVDRRVLEPAGMTDTAFLRSDSLPGRAALGYVELDGAERLNVLHMPLRGVGDGGLYTTVADVHRFWTALFGGRILPPGTVAEMTRIHVHDEDGNAYGMGFWHQGGDPDSVQLEGQDPGISFRSRHRPAEGTTFTVAANTSEGAWPVARALATALAERAGS